MSSKASPLKTPERIPMRVQLESTAVSDISNEDSMMGGLIYSELEDPLQFPPLSPPWHPPSPIALELEHDDTGADSETRSQRSSSPDLPNLYELLASTQPTNPSHAENRRASQISPPSRTHPNPKPQAHPTPTTPTPRTMTPPQTQNPILKAGSTARDLKNLSLVPRRADSVSGQMGSLKRARSRSPTPKEGEQQLISPTSTIADESISKAEQIQTPEKRQRTDRQRSRHPDFWLLDGNVVIQIENTLFRLHRSDLVRRSRYFARLLEPGKSGDPEEGGGAEPEILDGMRVYKVAGEALDFERLWNAVDDAISYVHQPPPFPVFASILRAATVLEFPSFRTWAIKAFEDMWPRSLSAVTETRKLYASESIALARECDVPGVLRHAFYELSRHCSFGLADPEEMDDIDDSEYTGSDDDVSNVNKDNEGDPEDSEEEEDSEEDSEEEDDDDDDGDDSKDVTDDITSQTPHLTGNYRLSRADLTRLIVLRTRLQADWLSVLGMPPTTCGILNAGKDSEKCAMSSSRWTRLVVMDQILQEGLMFDPLAGLKSLIEATKTNRHSIVGTMCEACKRKAMIGWEKRREKIWDVYLDIWLGLGTVGKK